MARLDRWAAWTALGLASVFVLGGCDTEKKKAGPNPYRREVRGADGKVAPQAPAATQAAAATRPAVASRPAPGTIGPPVLFVNKDALTVQDVLRPAIKSRLAKRAALLGPAEYRTELERTLHNELQTEIGLLLIFHEAKKTIGEKEDEFFTKSADDEIQQMVNLEFGGRHAKFEKWLQEQGSSVSEFREKTKRRFVAMKVLRERFNNLKEQPSRQELRRYYESHLGEFTVEAKAKMSLIEVHFAGAGAPGLRKPAAREKADRARQELDSGVPFAAVAKAYSDGLNRARGGAWDELGPGSLRPRYKPVLDALFKMKPGEISPVLEGPDAFFLLQCDAVTPGRQLTFEDAQPRILDRILDERYAEVQNEYVSKLLRNAVIVNENAFVQALLAAAPPPSAKNAGEQ